jgi:hypothetical protein
MATRSRYSPHPMLGAERAARRKVEEQTGVSWRRWLARARSEGPKTEKALGRWLQGEHGLAARAAKFLAWEALRAEVTDYDDPVPLVDALYAGPHAPLRPLHEAVVDALLALGDDVLVTACKTMVPAYRKFVFAELCPVEGGIEVRLALGGEPARGRLEPVRGRAPGDRLTHRVRVRVRREIDAELRGWLAFEVPDDFAKALDASAAARATWEGMTPAMRRDMGLWVTSAKQPGTRARRLATVIDKLAAGRRRVY